VPFLEDPGDPKDVSGHYYREALCMLETTVQQSKKSKATHALSNNVEQIKQRANTARMLAWSNVYKEWVHISESRQGDAGKQQQKTLLFDETFTKRVPSPRVKKLVEILKMIKSQKERFIILSDRLFLLHIAAQV
jgi:hypothetical protein